MDSNSTEIQQQTLGSFPPRELKDYLMWLPVRERLNVILEHKDAHAVVAAMAEQDFYLTVKEIGFDYHLPLLALARVDQLNYLFDLEWWQKDRIVAAKSLEWLEELAAASENKFIEWLYQVDFELLVTLFKKWIRVEVAPVDEDLLESRDQLPTLTLDDQFFWEASYPQYEDFLKRLVGYFFETHYGFYKELMHHIIVTQDAGMEEEAYRFHRGRLEDHAIPDFYDALEIYRAVRLSEIPHNKRIIATEQSHAVPSFALAMVSEDDLFGRAIREIHDIASLEVLKQEMAALSNKVVVADRISPDDPENLLGAANKVAAYVNLGLHLKTDGDVKGAVQILEEVFLEYLFRLSQSQVAGLRNRLRNVCQYGWLSQWPAGVNFLDPYWMERVELLLENTPRVLRLPHEADDSVSRKDFFRTPRDLWESSRLVDAVTAMGSVFDSLHVDPEEVEQSLWREGMIRNLEDVTLGTLLWTAAVRFQIEKVWKPEPLSVHLWKEVFLLGKGGVLEKVLRSRMEQVILDPEQRLSVEVYLRPLFKEYAEEMVAFSEDDPPDPRFVKVFLFRGE